MSRSVRWRWSFVSALCVACTSGGSSTPPAQPKDGGGGAPESRRDAAPVEGSSDAAVVDAAAAPLHDGSTAIDAKAGDAAPSANVFSEPFDRFDTSLWSCEYSCPKVSGGVARFSLLADAPPNENGSWSKIRYKARRFTSGKFTVRFALTARPNRAVWWGVALWDSGPSPDESKFNEINFGYTTNQSFTDTQLLFESAKLGKAVSTKVDLGVNLYDGTHHVAQLEYDAAHVSLYFDGTLRKTITDTSVIPTDPMDYVIGPRLVTGSAPLQAEFSEIVDSTEIEW